MIPLPQQTEGRVPAVKPIPDGYSAVTPYLIVADGAAAIAFYERAFGATVRLCLAQPNGHIGHAELAAASHGQTA